MSPSVLKMEMSKISNEYDIPNPPWFWRENERRELQTMGKKRAMTSSKMADILLRHPTTTTRRANRVLYISSPCAQGHNEMCTGRGSNQGPLGPKSDALTTAPLHHLDLTLIIQCKFDIEFQKIEYKNILPNYICLTILLLNYTNNRQIPRCR